MSWTASAASLALAAALLAGLTLWRAQTREGRAALAHPPTGRIVTVDGQRVHLRVQGRGPDIVLLHGASGNLADWPEALIDRLAADFRVIVMDRPGLGHSAPLPDGDASVAGQARVLRAAADALGATRPLVVGQSFGGSVALAWAMDHPVAGLVTISAPLLPWPGALDPWYRATSTAAGRAVLVPLAAAWVPESYVRAQIDAVFAPDRPPPGYLDRLGTDLTLRRSALAANTAQINALRAQLVAMEPRLPFLPVPVEMVHGTADTIVPAAIHAIPLAPRLPTAGLTLIEGAGHMPHHSHTAMVEEAVRTAARRAGLR